MTTAPVLVPRVPTGRATPCGHSEGRRPPEKATNAHQSCGPFESVSEWSGCEFPSGRSPECSANPSTVGTSRLQRDIYGSERSLGLDVSSCELRTTSESSRILPPGFFRGTLRERSSSILYNSPSGTRRRSSTTSWSTSPFGTEWMRSEIRFPTSPLGEPAAGSALPSGGETVAIADGPEGDDTRSASGGARALSDVSVANGTGPDEPSIPGPGSGEVLHACIERVEA
jgi:hypothetical protein